MTPARKRLLALIAAVCGSILVLRSVLDADGGLSLLVISQRVNLSLKSMESSRHLPHIPIGVSTSVLANAIPKSQNTGAASANQVATLGVMSQQTTEAGANQVAPLNMTSQQIGAVRTNQVGSLTQTSSECTVGASPSNCKIAMGVAITTKSVKSIDKLNMTSPFFKHLLPSFCRTASAGFTYTFYMAYDFDDHILKQPRGIEVFREGFDKLVNSLCRREFTVNLTFIRCEYNKKPAWAQNDALMAGYHDNMDYLYMANDDTIMETPGWTVAFVDALAKMKPRNVGMVGPQHRGGATAILTYNFVHRTHIDLFGYFYPRNFTDWYGDQWISRIYEPCNVQKVTNKVVKHTLEQGTRYTVHHMNGTRMNEIMQSTHEVLRSRLKSRGVQDVDKLFPKPVKKFPLSQQEKAKARKQCKR